MYVRNFAAFPVPAEKHETLKDSYWRALIPGTQTHYARGYHYGIDVPAPIGATVVAPDGGTVVTVGNVWGSAYGQNQVLILHTAGLGAVKWWTFYAHMEDRRVYRGQRVKAGQIIGNVGEQGAVTGPHLHMELHAGPGWTQVAEPRPITGGSTLFHKLVAAKRL